MIESTKAVAHSNAIFRRNLRVARLSARSNNAMWARSRKGVTGYSAALDCYELSQLIWRMTVMPVDLKVNWTDTDFAKLIGSVTDDRDWRLEVDADGIANLSDKTANPTGADYDETLHCFLETWMQGTDFVGPSAAGDKVLVGKIAKALRENYPVVKAEKFVYVDL